MADFSATLFRLETRSGERVVQTRRYTPILSFCLAAQTVIDVSETLLLEGFKYVLAYKFSQDHLELLFGRIRRMGGYNDNPNVVQLQQALRRLTLHNFITPSATGNCVPLDDGDDGLLRIRRPQRQLSVRDSHGVNTDSGMPAAVQLLLRSGGAGSVFSNSCVTYICGYVCRKLLETQSIKCAECVGALLCNADDPPPQEVMGLVKVRDNGGLVVPSAST